MNDDMKNLLAIRIDADLDGATLAGLAAGAVENKVFAVSVAPGDVATMWAWLEKTDVGVFGRQEIRDKGQEIESLAEQISLMFRNGADGVQVDLGLSELSDFCEQILPIRDDLFFNHKFIVGLDLCEINADDWSMVFENLGVVRADAIMLSGADENFVGRVYALLECMRIDFDMNIYFELINSEQIEQVVRLTQKIRPELFSRLRFFV